MLVRIERSAGGWVAMFPRFSLWEQSYETIIHSIEATVGRSIDQLDVIAVEIEVPDLVGGGDV